MKQAWSGDLKDVAELCGDAVALELHNSLPGISLYIPRKKLPAGRFSKLSKLATSSLIENFGGDTITIPGPRRSKDQTFAEIENLLKKNLTTAEIALHLGVTQTYVFQLRREMNAPKIKDLPDPRQTSLFDLN